MVAIRRVSCRWRGFVVVVVALGLLASSAAVVVGQEAAPTRGDELGDLTVLLGATATVDVSDAFVGSVTSYATRSSHSSSVAVSVNGAVVSLRAVGSGGSFVTVTASNAAGSASQRFFVEVPRPFAPSMTLQVTDQSLSAGALVAFDVPDSFGGYVTSYTVTSSDETLVSAALDNKVAVVRAVAEGSATVTFSAASLIGAASMSFAVTVTRRGVAAGGADTHHGVPGCVRSCRGS